MDLAKPALHIDWLTISQVHADAPDWGSALMVEFDPETGEAVREVVKSGHLKGSWESSLMIRCVSGKVEVSGNPSKWGRLESVGMGCATIFQAVKVYNGVLEGLGLPPFDYPDRLVVGRAGERGAIDRIVRKGPRVHWVHIAGNAILGSRESLGPYFDWLSTQRVGLRGHALESKGSLSVRAGTRRRRTLAIYAKGAEIAVQLARWRRKSKTVQDADVAQAYLIALGERCEALGWVRREVRLAGDYLKAQGLQWVEEWDENTMHKEWAAFGISTEEVGAVVDWKGEAMARFLARGLGERAARQRVETLLAWMGGADVGPGPGRSQATWYRIMGDLRDIMGVDIRSRPNVITLGSRAQTLARPVSARVATWADLQALYRDLPALSRAA